MNQVSQKLKMWPILVLAIIGCLLLMALPALAGEGDGSGGGSTVLLGLASSTPANGQTGVELQPLLKLTFNKNVINLAIRDANKKCFTLVTSAGSVVPIEVIMADDQLYPEEKRNISIKPLQALQPGTAYTLKISPELTAKNGTSLGHVVTLNFVTEGTATAAPTAPETQPDDSATASTAENNAAESGQTITSETEKTGDVKTEVKENTDLQTTSEINTDNQVKDQPVQQPAPIAEEQQDSYTIYLLAAGIALLAASGYAYYRKRNK